jgi:hypothetical protein
MGILEVLHDAKFNVFFSFILGIGLICIFRPQCSGSECNINKPPAEKDFDKYVYRMGGGSCYEFKTEIVNCPASGAVEAFQESSLQEEEQNVDNDAFRDQFARRNTVIVHPSTAIPPFSKTI